MADAILSTFIDSIFSLYTVEHHNDKWEMIGDKLKSSSNIPAAYTTCLAICAIVRPFGTQSTCDPEEAIWLEKLKTDLGDTLSLSSLLLFRLNSKTFQDGRNFTSSVSLSMLLNKGRGAIILQINR